MCVVSSIGDMWGETLPYRYPWVVPFPAQPHADIVVGADPSEVRKLREEVEELKKLLLAAKRFDEKTGQPDCELDEKIDLLRRVAKAVGVDLEEVFAKKPAGVAG